LNSYRGTSQVQEEGNNLPGFDLNKLPVAEFDNSSKEPNTIQ